MSKKHEPPPEHRARLYDQNADDNGNERSHVDAIITFNGNSIDIRVDGYGTREELDDCATPIFIEFYDGCLQVVIWNDINKADPMIVKMEDARINKRIDD